MKISTVIPALLLFAGLCGCGGAANKTAESQEASSVAAEKEHIVGGYTKPRKLTDEERQLFDSLTSQLDDVKYKPINVATQVVAGINYRFLCSGRDSAHKGKKFDAVIVIFKPLPSQGEPRITSVQRQER